MPKRRALPISPRIAKPSSRSASITNSRRRPRASSAAAAAAGGDVDELAGEQLELRATLPKAGKGARASVSIASVTYQYELVRCGKASCLACGGGPSHGPYWYAYWRDGARTRKKYIGKDLRGAGDVGR
jgi:hypothetical protein